MTQKTADELLRETSFRLGLPFEPQDWGVTNADANRLDEFVRSPEGNGVAERFIRALKGQLLWVQTFNTVDELRLALDAFKRQYNNHWIVEKNGYETPAEIRRRLLNSRAAA